MNRLIGEVRGIFNIITLVELVVAVIFIIVGLEFFSNPSISNNVISILVGIILIVNGCASIYAYIKRGGISLYNNNLLYGIILIIFGILALFLRNVLSTILGLYLVVIGIQRMNYGLLLKKFNESSWLITFVIGLLFIVIAVITFLTTADALIKVAGICFLSYGLIELVSIILLRHRSKFFLE